MIVNATQLDQSTWALALSGKLLFQARHAFQDAIDQAQHTSPRLIHLDLTDLVHIDSAGLGLMAIAHKKLNPLGIGLTVVNPQPTVRDILLLTKMDHMYPLFDSVAEASRQSKMTFLPPR